MDCSPPDSVRGILQAILEWVAMPSPRGSSRPSDQTHVSCLLHWQVSSLPLAPPGIAAPSIYSGILLHCVQSSYHYLMGCCPFACWLHVSPGMCGLYRGRGPHLRCGIFCLQVHGRSVNICRVSEWPLAIMHPLSCGPVDLSDWSQLRPFTFPQGTNNTDLPIDPQAWQAHS